MTANICSPESLTRTDVRAGIGVGELTFASRETEWRAARPTGNGRDEECEMAIAPLLDTGGGDWPADLSDVPWPRPALQLVPGDEPWDSPEFAGGDGFCSASSSLAFACAAVSPLVRTGRHVAGGRARRAAMRRRRAVVLGIVVAVLLCLLALPLASLGGSPTVANPRARGAIADESVYVVRPGDTLWSIAARFDRGGNPRPMAEALARETGSGVVVPGERIAIP